MIKHSRKTAKNLIFFAVLCLFVVLTSACGANTQNNSSNSDTGNNADTNTKEPEAKAENKAEMIFGIGDEEGYVGEEKDTFSSDESFVMEATFSEPVGSKDIDFILLKKIDGSEEMTDEWSDTIDPTWDSLVYDFHNVDVDTALEPGDYIVRIFKDGSELISEGTFSIE